MRSAADAIPCVNRSGQGSNRGSIPQPADIAHDPVEIEFQPIVERSHAPLTVDEHEAIAVHDHAARLVAITLPALAVDVRRERHDRLEEPLHNDWPNLALG